MAFSTKGIIGITSFMCAIAVAITFIPPEGIDYVMMEDNTRVQSKENFYKRYSTQKQKQASEDRKDDNNEQDINAYKEIAVPDDMSKESLLAYVEELSINELRRDLLINAINSIGVGSYALHGHENWRLDSFAGKSIDCSGFVAWCYNKIKFNTFGGCTTGEINSHYNETSKPLPGDIGNVTASEIRANGQNANYGHAGIWLGKNSSGANIYIDAGSGTITTCRTHTYLDWGRILVHPDMIKYDNEYYSSGNSDNNISDTSFTVKDPKDAKLPDTEFLRFSAKNNRRDILIIVDPGHGPANTPNINDWSTGEYYSKRGTPYGGQTEEDFSFHTGEYLKDMLVDAGFDVITTRKDINAIVPNKLRAYMAEEVKADLVVCIHWNGGGSRGPVRVVPKDRVSNTSPAADGIYEIYSKKQNERLGTNSFNNIYATQLAVFSACTRPFLYLETGFADNAQDIALLAGDENNKATAKVIADSIIEWYDNND